MTRNAIIFLISLLTMSGGFAQSEISVTVPARKPFAYLRFNVSAKKVYKDSLVMIWRNRQVLSEEESKRADYVDSLIQRIRIGDARMFIYDRKGRLFEKCSGNSEFLVGAYLRFRRNGNLKMKGSFNEDGDKHGVWIKFDRKGKARKTLIFENGFFTDNISN